MANGPPERQPLESSLERIDEAERRLEERGAVRSVTRERMRVRRERRARLWLITRTLVLPAVLAIGGAVAFLITLEAGGGDLSGTPAGTATLLVAVELLLPAAIAGLASSREGWLESIAYALLVFAIELALVFGVGFGLLDLGPRL